MKTVRVAAAVVKDDGRVFCVQRGYGEYKGFWEFPGGKIEAGEEPAQALVREIREELDCDVYVGSLIQTVEYDYPTFHLSMDCFWCTFTATKPTLLEANDSKWLDAHTLYNVRWLPADASILDRIQTALQQETL